MPKARKATAVSEGACSKCGKNPAVSGHAWCKFCFAAYLGARSRNQMTLAEGRGFGNGVDAMRETLAREFGRIGDVKVTCIEVADLIRRSPRPRMTI